jgi:hypothetical protein
MYGNETTFAAEPRGGIMQRCHVCNRQFGLVRHRWWGYQFCEKKCLNDFRAQRYQQIGRMTEWLRPRRGSGREASRLPSLRTAHR